MSWNNTSKLRQQSILPSTPPPSPTNITTRTNIKHENMKILQTLTELYIFQGKSSKQIFRKLKIQTYIVSINNSKSVQFKKQHKTYSACCHLPLMERPKRNGTSLFYPLTYYVNIVFFKIIFSPDLLHGVYCP